MQKEQPVSVYKVMQDESAFTSLKDLTRSYIAQSSYLSSACCNNIIFLCTIVVALLVNVEICSSSCSIVSMLDQLARYGPTLDVPQLAIMQMFR